MCLAGIDCEHEGFPFAELKNISACFRLFRDLNVKSLKGTNLLKTRFVHKVEDGKGKTRN